MNGAAQEDERHSFYTYCYCEENVYRLMDHLWKTHGVKDSAAVVVSNKAQKVAFWNHQDKGVTVWDYHVVLLARDPRHQNQLVVYDQSAVRGDFPQTLAQWLDDSFKPVRPVYEATFRVVPRDVYLKTLTSDRSHMANSGVPSPTYPCIMNLDGVATNLFSHFVEMDPEKGFGKVTNTLTEEFFNETIKEK